MDQHEQHEAFADEAALDENIALDEELASFDDEGYPHGAYDEDEYTPEPVRGMSWGWYIVILVVVNIILVVVDAPFFIY